MNNEFSKGVNKYLKKTDLGGSRVLDAGATPRRYEPVGGIKSHNERIHRESEIIDKNKSLPFSFSKPKKSQKPKAVICVNCGYTTVANKNTVGIICPKCKKFSKVEEITYE